MSFKQVFGRCLVVTICILSGIAKISNPSQDEKKLVDSYKKLHLYIKQSGYVVPLAPAVVETHSYEIILLTSALLLLGSILVIFNFRLGHYIITLLFVAFCAVIHNPVLYNKENDILLQVQLLVLNLTVVAGLWLACGKGEKVKVKTE